MTDFDELVLQITMRKVQAWERLNDPGYCCNLGMAGFHQLLLDAGFTPKAARKAASQHGWDRLERQETL